MTKGEHRLAELCDWIYGNGTDVEINYDDMTINYNENGDTYYYLDCYSNGEPKNIFVSAKTVGDNEKCSAYVCLSTSDDRWYETLDYIEENGEDIERRLNDRFESNYRELLKKRKES